MSGRTIHIAIAEDNVFLLKAVKEKLSFFDDIKIVFTADNGEKFLTKLEDHRNIDLIIMDIEMPIMDGIETTAKVKGMHPQIKIIMLTVFDNDENIFKAIRAGADGYLLKEINPRDLYDGIQETLNGGAAMNPSIAMKTLKLLRNPLTIQTPSEKEAIQLSKREVEVLEHVSKGLSATKIAENLFLSHSTVRKHIEKIYKKLQVHNKLEAVQKAKDRNII